MGRRRGRPALSVVSVTPETVQSAIATLARPDAYRRTVTLEQIWSGGSGTVEVEVSVRDGWTRTDKSLPGGQVRHAVTDGEETYIWYDGEKTAFTVPAGDISADDEQGIPTYEDVLELPEETIAAADHRMISGMDCIYVETAADSDGYVLRYWVELDTRAVGGGRKTAGRRGGIPYGRPDGRPDRAPGVGLHPAGRAGTAGALIDRQQTGPGAQDMDLTQKRRTAIAVRLSL